MEPNETAAQFAMQLMGRIFTFGGRSWSVNWMTFRPAIQDRVVVLVGCCPHPMETKEIDTRLTISGICFNHDEPVWQKTQPEIDQAIETLWSEQLSESSVALLTENGETFVLFQDGHTVNVED